jgi:hypothetical protein
MISRWKFWGDSGKERCANGGFASHGNIGVRTCSIYVMGNL